jgi:hypothetical protein
MITPPRTSNPTEQVLPVPFYFPAYPFLHSFFFQITTDTTRTDTTHPDTTISGTATGVIVREDRTGNAIDRTTSGGLEATREDGNTDGNAMRGLVSGVGTTCKSTALHRVTVVTVMAIVAGEETQTWEGLYGYS